MTHVSTKMKRKHEVAIYENKRARGRHKGKGYTIATVPYINLLHHVNNPQPISNLLGVIRRV